MRSKPRTVPNIFSLLKLNVYYRKMLILYTALTLVVLVVTATFLMTYFGNDLEREIYRSNSMLLQQIKAFSDEFLVSEINVPLSEFILPDAAQTAVSSFLSSSGTSSASLFLKTYRELNRIQLRHDYIESVYIWRRSDGVLISSREGLVLHPRQNDSPGKGLVNMGLIDRALGSPAPRIFVSPLENGSYWNEYPVISVIQAVPVYPSTGVSGGYAVININVDRFMNAIKSNDDKGTAFFFAIDPEGRQFLHSDPQLLLDPPPAGFPYPEVMNSEEGFTFLDDNGVSSALFWTTSELINWTYVSTLPVEQLSRQISRSKSVSLLFIIIIAFVSIGFSLFITHILYQFVSRFTRTVRKNLQLPGADTINPRGLDALVADLNEKQKEVDRILDNNRELLEFKLSIDLLFGYMLKTSAIREQMKLLRKEFGFKRYAVALIEIDQEGFNQFSPEHREYLLHLVTNTAADFFGHFGNYICTRPPDDHIAVLLNVNTIRLVVPSLHNLLEQIQGATGLRHNVTMSGSATDIRRFPSLYGSAKHYLNYRYLFGYGSILSASTIRRMEKESLVVDLKILREMEELLQRGDYEEFKNRIILLIDDFQGGNYSLDVVKAALLQMVILIGRFSRERSVNVEELNHNRIIHHFEQIKTIHRYKDWVFSLIDILQKGIEERMEGVDPNFIEQIIQFIRANADKQISQWMVADHFSVSQSHLSRIFATNMGVSYSDFVINVKFERAAELLIEKPKDSITEIAHSLGYLDLAYFAKIFKTRYGYTPSRYRKQMKSMERKESPKNES